MECYIMYDGDRFEVSPEKLALLKSERLVPNEETTSKSFQRKEVGQPYYYIDDCGRIGVHVEVFDNEDDLRYQNGNYFGDIEAAAQRVLHENLDRKLYQYAMQKYGRLGKYGIRKNARDVFMGENNGYFFIGDKNGIFNAYFLNEVYALQAVLDVVEPFMKENPEFVWEY